MPRPKKVPDMLQLLVALNSERNLRFEYKGNIKEYTEELAKILFYITNGTLYRQLLESLHEQVDEETYKAVLASWTEKEQQVLNATASIKKAADEPYIDPMNVFQHVIQGE